MIVSVFGHVSTMANLVYGSPSDTSTETIRFRRTTGGAKPAPVLISAVYPDSSESRCLCLRSTDDKHLRQCRAGGDRKPDSSLPLGLQTKLHGARLPSQHAIHHRAPGLHGQPSRGPVCAEILPLQGRSAQRLLCSVQRGRLMDARQAFNLTST